MMRKGLLGIFAILLICGCGNKKEQKTKAPVRVEREIVGTDNTNRFQQYVGIVEENEGTAVSFTGMGVVRRVLVDEGQAVRRGQLIAVMEDTQASNMLSDAEETYNFKFTRKNAEYGWGDQYIESTTLSITNNKPDGQIITMAHSTKRLSTVATAAPSTPIAGAPSLPKIRI